MKILTESCKEDWEELDKTLLIVAEEDPIFFAEYFLGIHLNNFQKRALTALAESFLTGGSKEIMWVTANQVGKTVALAVAHAWVTFFKKGFSGEPELIDKAHYETLNISPISRQSKEAFRYIEEILNSNFSWEEGGKRFVNKCKTKWYWKDKNEQMGRIDFSNNSNSYCLSTSEDQGAGFAGKQFGLISYDECVQSHHLEEELPARIFSRTAKYSGPIILVATPDEMAKSQQYWYHLYTEAKEKRNQWKLIEGLYDDNIFIPEKTRDEYKERLKLLDPLKYRQVVLGQFIASADRMFPPELVEGLWNGKKEATSPQPEKKYVLVSDWGIADSGDETVMLVGDITDLKNPEIVYGYSKRGGDPVELMAMASYLKLQYNDADLVMDTASLGGEIFRKMLSSLSPIPFIQQSKADALTFLQIRLRNNLRKGLTKSQESGTNKIRSYYLPKLQEQLSCYKIEDKKLKQDWVMALAMLCWYLDKHCQSSKIQVFNIKNFYKK